MDATLVGPVSVDRYPATGDELPGGGALNMAYHWARRGLAFELVTRVGTDRRPLFESFLDRHRIARTDALVVPGASCSIDIVFEDDRQPWMDHFVEGVWSDFRFTEREADVIGSGTPAHLILVDAVDRELHRWAAGRRTGEARLTGDFLSFRHLTPERFASSAALLEICFVGWPGAVDDPMVAVLADHAAVLGNVLVVTFGAQAVLVADGRSRSRRDQWFDVDARPVLGTTVGCGDAFIAAFLAEWYASADIAGAVAAGMELGAAATEWMRPLPDAAYA